MVCLERELSGAHAFDARCDRGRSWPNPGGGAGTSVFPHGSGVGSDCAGGGAGWRNLASGGYYTGGPSDAVRKMCVDAAGEELEFLGAPDCRVGHKSAAERDGSNGILSGRGAPDCWIGTGRSGPGCVLFGRSGQYALYSKKVRNRKEKANRKKDEKSGKKGLTIEGGSGIVCKLLRNGGAESETRATKVAQKAKKVLDKAKKKW